MAGYISVGRNTNNPYQQMVRTAVDQTLNAAGNLKRVRSLIEAMRTTPDGGQTFDYTPAASAFGMSVPDVQGLYALIVAADPITTSAEFGALVTFLG
jgi:hypothetical protein